MDFGTCKKGENENEKGCKGRKHERDVGELGVGKAEEKDRTFQLGD